MLRALAIFLLLTTPAFAWEMTAGRFCELTHVDEAATVRVTYDPALSEYAIAITQQSAWSADPLFAIRFDGPRGLTISTDRHFFSADRKTLTVKDSGFGNVLNGIEFNETATAVLGDQALTVPLAGAGPAVQAFRACTSGLGV